MKTYILNAILLIITFSILTQFIKEVTTTYSDEYYHLIQTMTYKNGEYSKWNKHLTTFPLLFLITSKILLIFEYFSFGDIHYRYISYAFSLFLLVLINKFSFRLFSCLKIRFIICLFTLPINFFFYFLYYTETLSIFFVFLFFYNEMFLSSWSLWVSDGNENSLVNEEGKCVNDRDVVEINKNILKKKYLYTSINIYRLILGFLAVLSRQNNIIWINFFILYNIINNIFKISSLSFSELISKINHTLVRFKEIIFLDLLFIAFIYYNDYSIVLGDKNNHSLSFHLSQLLHFLLFLYLLFPSLLLSLIKFYFSSVKTLLSKRIFYKETLIKVYYYFLLIIISMVLIVLSESLFLYNHVFIKTDDTHLSSFINQNVFFNKKNNRYRQVLMFLIIPHFIYNFIIKEKVSNRKPILSFMIVVSMLLIPTPLFEFRYFCLPFSLLLLLSTAWKMRIKEYLFTYLNIIFFMIVNFLMIYSFLYLPYNNGRYEFLCRFMW